MPAQPKSLVLAFALCAATPAWADLTPASTGNSSFALVAFNTTTHSYYVRDLGYSLNEFLPSGVTTSPLDGGGSPVIGDKSPEEGLHLSWGDTTGGFAHWLAGQNTGDLMWTVAGGDGQVSAGGTPNRSRLLVVLSQLPFQAMTNAGVRNAVSSNNGISALADLLNDGTSWYDRSGFNLPTSFTTNNLFGAATLTGLNQAAALLYYTTTTNVGSSVAPASYRIFSNTLFTSTMTLSSDGVLQYELMSTALLVSTPGTPAMMLAGLVGLGLAVRRARTGSQST